MDSSVKRWILRYRGEPNAIKGMELLSLLKARSIKIVDNSLPKMVLVAGTTNEMNSAKGAMDANWIVAEENRSYPIPDTRKKITT